MFIRTIVVGVMEANCYLVGDDCTKEIFVIDPGGDYRKIKKIIDRDGLKPHAIINTHGHGDHIAANSEFGLPIWIHRLDADFLQDPSKNLSATFGFFIKTKQASRLLEDGDVLDIGKSTLEVIHTPGHTAGSISLKGDAVIFTGDTLFCEGIGRTDFAYGSEKDIMHSIKERLLTLPDDYLIYPGHGPSSTIGNEKRHNPFII
jgi:glyoxylase-like metal-dependent hydrolase (beta-lactamase superfamily II)